MAQSGRAGGAGAAVREYDKVKFKCLQKKIPQGTRNNKLGQAKDTNVSTTDAILAALQVATLAAPLSPSLPPLLLSLSTSFFHSFFHSFYAVPILISTHSEIDQQ